MSAPLDIRHRGVWVWITALIAAAALAVTPLARADTYSWQGLIGASRSNGNCSPWYPGQSACASYYGNWYEINATWETNDWDLAGFENSSTIRGVYIFAGSQSAIVTPGQLSMGGSVLPQVTWCSWDPNCTPITGNSYIWFRAWN